ncbi:hypothetical protein [Saccharicrinis aurantiacus]|uniref:hypothetical protein n=1 Tax=Saccharicrinis aurantiacus TaxID=1849719 RepID=UPI0024927BCC|nr:hypothetical protein [Saccharicrinis aurantiacus]
MKFYLNTSQAKFIEKAESALSNAKTNPKIVPMMSKFMYDATKIEEGLSICNSAREAFNSKTKEDKESKQAKNLFETTYESVKAKYFRDKELCGRLFKKEPNVLIDLGIVGNTPTNFELLVNQFVNFYKVIIDKESIQLKTSLIDLGLDEATACAEQVNNLIEYRRDYKVEVGESQNATKVKDHAIFELKEWMDDFDNMAQIALYDQPQLLETLGIFVRS